MLCDHMAVLVADTCAPSSMGAAIPVSQFMLPRDDEATGEIAHASCMHASMWLTACRRAV